MGDRRLSNGVSCAEWLIIRDAANPVCVCVDEVTCTNRTEEQDADVFVSSRLENRICMI